MQNDTDKNLIATLASSISLPYELAAILVARGIDTTEAAQKFLSPKADDLAPPTILSGISQASGLIASHISRGSTITVFGDYDCDGIGASAILYLTLKHLGAQTTVYIPTRQEDGYGLSIDTLQKVIDRDAPGLIITVDCGIGSVQEVSYARDKGIDFVVTDHHEPQSILPDCTIINPKLQKGVCEYSGAGVAFKLCEALAGREFALGLVDICAISTIADLVPLRGENRIIARLGLEKLSSREQRAGIKALLKAAGIKPNDTKISSYDIAFKIAPRLNASGRLSNADKSFRLLVEDDPTLISLLANELEAENKRRQELCQQTIDEAVVKLKDYDLVTNKVIVLSEDSWEGGVIGIAAAKIAQDYYRPTILFARKDNMLKGSCRSIAGISIYDVLDGCKDKIAQFGGHSMAAGLSIAPENLDDFIEAVNAYVATNYPNEIFYDSCRYDIAVDIKKVDAAFARSLQCFEPYGNDNPMPSFLYKAGSVAFKRIGNHNHIKYAANRECELVAFNAYDKIDQLLSDMPKSLYFSIDFEIFRNSEKAKCYLKAFTLDKIAPTQEALLLGYLQALATNNVDHAKGKGCRSTPLYGHLVTTYSKDTFDKLCRQYPTYRRAYRRLETSNPYNTVLLSPDIDIDTNHYCIVQNVDKLYHETAAAGDDTSSIDALFFDVEIKGFDIDCVREIFVFLYTTQNGRKYHGQDELYGKFVAKEYTRSRICFEISCLILKELGLFCIEKGSIIIRNQKVDIEASKIYTSLGALCRLS